MASDSALIDAHINIGYIPENANITTKCSFEILPENVSITKSSLETLPEEDQSEDCETESQEDGKFQRESESNESENATPIDCCLEQHLPVCADALTSPTILTHNGKQQTCGKIKKRVSIIDKPTLIVFCEPTDDMTQEGNTTEPDFTGPYKDVKKRKSRLRKCWRWLRTKLCAVFCCIPQDGRMFSTFSNVHLFSTSQYFRHTSVSCAM